MANLPRKIGRSVKVTTTTPELDLSIRCESCDGPLTFIQSSATGEGEAETLDHFVCRGCGSAFDYRRSTRSLSRSA